MREQLGVRSYSAVAMGVGRLQRQLPHKPQLRKQLRAIGDISMSNVKIRPFAALPHPTLGVADPLWLLRSDLFGTQFSFRAGRKAGHPRRDQLPYRSCSELLPLLVRQRFAGHVSATHASQMLLASRSAPRQVRTPALSSRMAASSTAAKKRRSSLQKWLRNG